VERSDGARLGRTPRRQNRWRQNPVTDEVGEQRVRQRAGSYLARCDQLGNDAIAIRDQDGLATSREAKVLAQRVLQRLKASRSHARLLASRTARDVKSAVGPHENREQAKDYEGCGWRRAIEIAHRRKAKLLALRAATSLAGECNGSRH
jgi:hypothetical protein